MKYSNIYLHAALACMATMGLRAQETDQNTLADCVLFPDIKEVVQQHQQEQTLVCPFDGTLFLAPPGQDKPTPPLRLKKGDRISLTTFIRGSQNHHNAIFRIINDTIQHLGANAHTPQEQHGNIKQLLFTSCLMRLNACMFILLHEAQSIGYNNPIDQACDQLKLIPPTYPTIMPTLGRAIKLSRDATLQSALVYRVIKEETFFGPLLDILPIKAALSNILINYDKLLEQAKIPRLTQSAVPPTRTLVPTQTCPGLSALDIAKKITSEFYKRDLLKKRVVNYTKLTVDEYTAQLVKLFTPAQLRLLVPIFTLVPADNRLVSLDLMVRNCAITTDSFYNFLALHLLRFTASERDKLIDILTRANSTYVYEALKALRQSVKNRLATFSMQGEGPQAKKQRLEDKGNS